LSTQKYEAHLWVFNLTSSSSKGSDDSKEKEPTAAPPQPNPADLVLTPVKAK
jgi:hypothetical protein